MKKIMCVDDEKFLMAALDAIFKNEGFEVIQAFSGFECLEKLKTEKPDLILMDIMMPEMTGIETIQKIRNNPATKDLRIAILTVRELSETGVEALKKAKVVDYITKPFDNAELVKRVKKLVR